MKQKSAAVIKLLRNLFGVAQPRRAFQSALFDDGFKPADDIETVNIVP
jgi:hypothetical protein